MAARVPYYQRAINDWLANRILTLFLGFVLRVRLEPFEQRLEGFTKLLLRHMLRLLAERKVPVDCIYPCLLLGVNHHMFCLSLLSIV